MTLFNPWQWFCSTRTLSNSSEMVLTIVALNFWPWELAGDIDGRKTKSLSTPEPIVQPKAVAQPSVFQTTADITK